MKENLETYTTPELVVIGEANELEIPCYKNGKTKLSKSALIDLLVDAGVEVAPKVEESKAKSGKESVTFHRPKPVSQSRRFKLRRF